MPAASIPAVSGVPLVTDILTIAFIPAVVGIHALAGVPAVDDVLAVASFPVHRPELYCTMKHIRLSDYGYRTVIFFCFRNIENRTGEFEKLSDHRI